MQVITSRDWNKNMVDQIGFIDPKTPRTGRCVVGQSMSPFLGARRWPGSMALLRWTAATQGRSWGWVGLLESCEKKHETSHHWCVTNVATWHTQSPWSFEWTRILSVSGAIAVNEISKDRLLFRASGVHAQEILAKVMLLLRCAFFHKTNADYCLQP